MVELPADFVGRMKTELGSEFDEFLSSYDRPAEKAVRVNTLKITRKDFEKIAPLTLDGNVPWEENGYYVKGDGLGKTVFHAAGLYYVQEPSAMCAAPELGARAGERVLDLCSAPGGKGTQLAQSMHGEGIIFLNEINFRRAKILSSNVERMGIKNAVVCCAPPEKLAGEFVEYFDKILVDAPCSGEGMFKKESSAIPEWSVENVSLCAKRQADILGCAYRMLAKGGRMVYSTCTFSRDEDELQISGFISAHSDCKLVNEKKLYPHKIRGEGHYCAVIEKTDGTKNDIPVVVPTVRDKKALALYREWERRNLKISFKNVHAVGQTLYSLPDDIPRASVQTLRAGVRLGELTGNRFEPSHSLAMCLEEGEAESIDVDEKVALSYLRGSTFGCGEDINGWKLVTHKGFPIGWCKVSCGIAKNHLPKGLRI